MSVSKSPPIFATRVGRALRFARLLGDDGLVSLTNLAVWVALARLATTPAPSVLDLGVFMGAMLAYRHKAHCRPAELAEGPPAEVTELGGRIGEIATKVAGWESKLETLNTLIRLGSKR